MLRSIFGQSTSILGHNSVRCSPYEPKHARIGPACALFPLSCACLASLGLAGEGHSPGPGSGCLGCELVFEAQEGLTYTLDGRQYVVIAAGGHGDGYSHLGDTLMAFAVK